jgi:hypothetical protein
VIELTKMVNSTIDDIIARGDVVTKAWAIAAIIQKHPRPAGADADYWTAVEQIAVDAMVRNALRLRRQAEEKATPDQPTLPGFERLQRSYSVVRDGEQCLVPIDQLTAEEGRSKVAYLRALAEANVKHARELENYLKARAN